MSARSSGMMAHLTKPGNLDDALDRVMLQDDPADPVPTTPISIAPVEAPAAETIHEVRPTVRRGKTEKGTDSSVLGELAALQKRPRNKVTLNTRIDDWIEAAINKALRDLQESGVTNVTKEAIVIQSLIRGLKLTPPEGWEAL